MAGFAFLFFAAGIGCLIFTSRGLAGLMFATAVGFLLVPQLGTSLAVARPAGFSMADEGVAPPEVEFRTSNGKRLSLEDFRGQVVLLNIWATWCDSCRDTVSSMDRLKAIHGADGLEVIAVSVGDEGANQVRRFLRQSGVSNLALYFDKNQTTQNALGSGPLPVTMLIDRSGNVVGSLFGAAEWDSTEALDLIRHYLDS